jgi:hypothetical protein
MNNAELIDSLRNVCGEKADCYHCHSKAGCYGTACMEYLCHDAADLIEAQQKALDECAKQLADMAAQMPKEGEWLRTDAFPHRIYCSVCYKTYVPNDRWQIWVDGDIPKKFCPNCGAKMKGERNDK